MVPRVVHVTQYTLHVLERVPFLRLFQGLVAHLELLEHRRRGPRLFDAHEELVHLQDPAVDARRQLFLDLTQAQGVERLGFDGGGLGELAGFGGLPRDGLLRDEVMMRGSVWLFLVILVIFGHGRVVRLAAGVGTSGLTSTRLAYAFSFLF